MQIIGQIRTTPGAKVRRENALVHYLLLRVESALWGPILW